ncbi:LytR/AlgR family response regulator transcription factor [Sinomicrobium weinanense]|uniref:Response regulator transcription factor n=1 Tax=Sinomicrobium weinanense TaxID=2842200 RepID=A0A926JQM7_9FLAO|nr:LytTR family DNA-binding domain-containing protein [Sinomicrobium weinanense]MBC9795507.1 response regulator transcription factor [Sinomicrobium weinanense]MBU3123346.1 LytTR family DNA-binding domain-containing protein [Sinomicrobium weinanense]
MKIKCIIIDDEPLAISVLQSHSREFQNLEIIACHNNPIEAMATLENRDVDVIFLDINMPKMSGLDFIKNINHDAFIVITTAYREYAVESYELDVFDYLVKPIPFHRFAKTVNKLAKDISIKRSGFVNIKAQQEPHMFLKVDKKMVKINLNDILFIESLKDYIKVVTAIDEYIVHKSLTNITEELPASQFIRVHRSYTIAIDKVKAVEGNILEINNKRIPIGRNYTKQAKDSIFKDNQDLI